jgi:hypothetical protein
MSPPDPLFLPDTGQTAIDERCDCGHARSEHDDRYTTYGGRAVDLPGLGRCCEPGCACGRFHFHCWIVEA